MSALIAARHYLRFVLGGRRGCRVLEGLEKGDAHEIIEECAEAFETFAASKGWQPIETAPKDGARILFYDPQSSGLVMSGCWDKEFESTRCDEATGESTFRGAWTDYSVASFGYEEYNEFSPTHWMPLPEPPKP